jgi:hypothetical protein
VALGQEEAAKELFQQVLRTDPNFKLDRTISPRIRSVFDEAKAAMAKELALHPPPVENLVPQGGPPPEVLKPLPPADIEEGHALTVLVDAKDAARLEMHYRTEGESGYNAVLQSRAPSGRFEPTVPGLHVRPPSLQYYLVAHAASGQLTGLGASADAPFALTVHAAEQPFYKRGWFYGLIGGVVAAGVVAALVSLIVIETSPSSLTIQPQ